MGKLEQVNRCPTSAPPPPSAPTPRRPLSSKGAPEEPSEESPTGALPRPARPCPPPEPAPAWPRSVGSAGLAPPLRSAWLSASQFSSAESTDRQQQRAGKMSGDDNQAAAICAVCCAVAAGEAAARCALDRHQHRQGGRPIFECQSQRGRSAALGGWSARDGMLFHRGTRHGGAQYHQPAAPARREHRREGGAGARGGHGA